MTFTFAFVEVCKDSAPSILFTIDADDINAAYQWIADHWCDSEVIEMSERFEVPTKEIKTGEDVKDIIARNNDRSLSYYLSTVGPRRVVNPKTLGIRSAATAQSISEENEQIEDEQEAPAPDYYKFRIVDIEDYNPADPEYVVRNKARYTCRYYNASFGYIILPDCVGVYIKVHDPQDITELHSHAHVLEIVKQLSASVVYPF